MKRCAFCRREASTCPYLGPHCLPPRRSGAAALVPVVAAVVAREGKVLLCRRPPHKRHGGLWEFPGGKLLEEETLGEALERELAEELGLRLTAVGRHLGWREDPETPFRLHFVEAEVTGEPLPLEHDQVVWVAEEEVAAYPLAPGDLSFVRARRRDAGNGGTGR